MNDEEIRSTIEQIKAQVMAKPENKEKTEDEIDEMILDAFYKAYTEGKMTKDDLGGLAQAMGYEFTEDFDQDPMAAPEVGAEGGEPGAPAAPGATEEDLEAVRTMEPGETPEEFQEKVEDVKEGGNAPEAPADEGNKGDEGGNPAPAANEGNKGDEGEEEESEEDERKKASELWKMNLNK